MDCECAEGFFVVTERTIQKQKLGDEQIFTQNDIGKKVETMKEHVHDCGYVMTRNAEISRKP